MLTGLHTFILGRSYVVTKGIHLTIVKTGAAMHMVGNCCADDQELLSGRSRAAVLVAKAAPWVI